MYKILFVDNPGDSSWAMTVKRSVKGVANITMVSEKELLPEIHHSRYDLVLIDSVGVTDIVKYLYTITTGAKGIPPIIIATTSRSPEMARSVFLAGAADYILQSLDEPVVRENLLEILQRLKREKPRCQ